MTPASLTCLLLTLLLTANQSFGAEGEGETQAPEEQNSYETANAEYRDAFFSYLEKKSLIPQNLQKYEDSKAQISVTEAEVNRIKNELQQLSERSEVLQSELQSDQVHLGEVIAALLMVERNARSQLDAPTDADVIEQLAVRVKTLKKLFASYTSNIAIEKRKMARIRRSPQYNFYSKEIGIRKKRLARLQREEESAKVELELIAREAKRLTRLKKAYSQRLDEAVRILPDLARELSEANEALDAAQRTGGALKIQKAQSNFDQAHANHRRFEVQRNDAERGVLETAAVLEKKNQLSDEKNQLLQLIVVEKTTARTEWKQLYAEFKVYHATHVKAVEDRLNELVTEKDKTILRISASREASQSVSIARQVVVKQRSKVAVVTEKIVEVKTAIAAASNSLEAAKSSVLRAKQYVAEMKAGYNQSIADSASAYQLAIEKQKINEKAGKAETSDSAAFAQKGLL